MTFRTIRAMFRRLLAAAVVLGALAGCSGSDGDEGPSATIEAADPDPTTTSTTEAPAPEEEVEAAYLKSWEVYAASLESFDGSRYAEVYAEDALRTRLEELARLKAANTPVRIDVKHDYTLQVIDEGRQAVVLDYYENHSVLLDGETGEPIEPDPNKVVGRQYAMKRIDGAWKIVTVTDAP